MVNVVYYNGWMHLQFESGIFGHFNCLYQTLSLEIYNFFFSHGSAVLDVRAGGNMKVFHLFIFTDLSSDWVYIL